MSNNSSNKSKGDQKQLPQYGKKGHKPRGRFERREVSLDEIQTNDISYWNKTSGFKDVTKFNWDLIIGHKRNISKAIGTSESLESSSLFYNPPQVMKVNFVMGPGFASSVDDPVNRALSHIMAKVRASLSTSNIGFETADLGIMFASTSSIAAIIGYAKRVLESYTVWKDRNYVYPRALIKAMGCDYNDIANNINTYSAKLNSAIDRYNNMSLLDCFDVYDRQYSMCHNIFADEDTQYGQLYIFKPDNYYRYDDTTTPSQATSTEFSPNSFTAILNAIEGALSTWYNSSDLYQINGTLLRAFKDAPRQHIPHYEQTDIIEPVVDRSFLMQIMNCTLEDDYLSDVTLDITQNPLAQNYIIWQPSGDPTIYPADYAREAVLLRLFEEDISEDDNMELTRLINMPVTKIDEDENDILVYENSGSEIVTNIQIYTFDATVGTSVPVRISTFSSNELEVDTLDPAEMVRKMCDVQAFRYIPCFYVIAEDDDSASHFCGTLGDVYNWMIYSQADWKTLNYVAFQSLWTPKNM